jgi:hypothetical protein
MSFSPFDIRMALKEAAAGSSLFNANRLSFFCYCYDPGENKYIFNLSRSLAALLFLVMISSLAVFLIARRKDGKR